MWSAIAFFTLLGASPIALPGGPPVAMDYLAYDAGNHRLWVPAGNTGRVDVLDTDTGKVTAVPGFPTIAAKRGGRPSMGPSSATVADGTVWIGNRGDNRLCPLDAKTLERRACLQLPAMPDGLAYVAATHELWATVPSQRALTIVAAGGPAAGAPATLALDGEPEGYAVDGARALFYTNLEDKDATLAIDVKARKVVARWSPGCGEAGPRGLALDPARRWLFVACTDGAVTLDLAHGGKPLGRLTTGGGVDNIDYVPETRQLYIASGKTATLTIVQVADSGALSPLHTAPTAEGARVVVVGAGTAYVADSAGGRLLAVKPPR